MLSSSQNFLFNFSASTGGGGLKRLEEYSRWFQASGGSIFIVSPLVLNQLSKMYPKNRYFSVYQSTFDRVFRDQDYIRNLPIDFNKLDFYFSYGIPIYSKIAKKNWFHLSNVAPFNPGIEKTLIDLIRYPVLKYKFLKNLNTPEFISAESMSSFDLLPQKYKNKFICLLNGSDDEIKNSSKAYPPKDYAVAVGTHPYKRIDRVLECFKNLQKQYGLNKLYIFGDYANLDKKLLNNKNIVFMGLQKRDKVIETIASSKLYISCTTVENSFNAASEGIFLSKNSLISDIGPHRELLKNEIKNEVLVNGQNMFMVSKHELRLKNVISWDSVIRLMLKKSGIGL